MRSKAPEGVFVLSDLPQVDPKSIQVEDLAELTLLYHLAQPFDGGMVHQEMADQHRHAPLGPLPGHRFGIAHVEREWLLDQYRFAGLDHLLSDLRMCGSGGRDNDRVHGLEQHRDVARDHRAWVLPRHPLPNLGVRIAHRGELRLRQSSDGANVIAPPRPSADYANLEARHR